MGDEYVCLRFPPDRQPAVVAGQWERGEDGWIEAVFNTPWELWICLTVLGIEVERPKSPAPNWWRQYE